MKKFLSTLISLALTVSPLSSVGAATTAPAPKVPDFVRELTPPPGLGFVDSYFKGETSKPVVLIQDLHANYGVQKKIIGILEHLQPKVAQGGRPMIIGLEAAWGDVDLSFLRNEDRQAKQQIGDYFLKEAEMDGPEFFAMMSEIPVRLVGVDDPHDYLLHGGLIRKSVMARLALAQKIDALRKALNKSKSRAPHQLRALWKIEEAFQRGDLGLPELASRLGVPTLPHYGAAEELLYNKKLAIAKEESGKKGLFLRNLVRADQDLALLSRLFRLQLTLEDVQYVAKQLPEILTVVQMLMPGENMEAWKETVRAAIDYYAIALLRDKPLAEHAYQLVADNPDQAVVVVTGGFHTAGIAKTLRDRKISYVVVAPLVESHTIHDETLYLRRVLGEELNAQDILASSPLLAASRSYALRTWARKSVLQPFFWLANSVRETARGERPIADYFLVDTQKQRTKKLAVQLSVWDDFDRNRYAYRGPNKRYYDIATDLLRGQPFRGNGKQLTRLVGYLALYPVKTDTMFWSQENLADQASLPISAVTLKEDAFYVIAPSRTTPNPQGLFTSLRVQEVEPAAFYTFKVTDNGFQDIRSSQPDWEAALMAIKLNVELGQIPSPYNDNQTAAGEDLQRALTSKRIREGNQTVTVQLQDHHKAEETLFTRSGVTIVIDKDLSEELKTLAILKGLTNILHPRGEAHTMRPFVSAAVRFLGINVIVGALQKARATLNVGVGPMLDLFLRLQGAMLNKFGKDLATVEPYEQAQWIDTHRDFVQLLIDRLLETPEVKDWLKEAGGDLLPIDTTGKANAKRTVQAVGVDPITGHTILQSAPDAGNAEVAAMKTLEMVPVLETGAGQNQFGPMKTDGRLSKMVAWLMLFVPESMRPRKEIGLLEALKIIGTAA